MDLAPQLKVMTMNRFFFSVFGAMALSGLLLAVPGCSSDDGGGDTGSQGSNKSAGTGKGGSGSGSKGSGSGSGGGGGSSSRGSSEESSSYGFCLGNSGWTCPSAEAKAACLKGSCGPCSKDPSQCSDDNGGGGDDDNGGGGDDNGGGGDDDNGGGDDF